MGRQGVQKLHFGPDQQSLIVWQISHRKDQRLGIKQGAHRVHLSIYDSSQPITI